MCVVSASSQAARARAVRSARAAPLAAAPPATESKATTPARGAGRARRGPDAPREGAAEGGKAPSMYMGRALLSLSPRELAGMSVEEV